MQATSGIISRKGEPNTAMGVRAAKNKRFELLRLWILLTSAAFLLLPQTSLGSDEEIAFRWAPIHYQDVDTTGDHSENGRADYLTAIDYDGDWDTSNNWDNLDRHPLEARVY